MGDRIHHQAGDARDYDLGEEAYDIVPIANLLHHFSEDENRDLLLRVARALRPGSLVVIGDMIPPEPGTPASPPHHWSRRRVAGLGQVDSSLKV
jgi:SAM-dependent methyltransferase